MLKTLTLAILCITCCPQLLADDRDFNVESDVVYGHKDGMALTYDVLTPEDANGVGLILMVSGGWVSSWNPPDRTAQFVRPMLDQGYTVFAVRHGSSPRYIIPEIARDVKLALEHVHENATKFKIDADRLGVFGFSAGGHLSLLLGTQSNDKGMPGSSPRVRAVVAVFPPTDLAPYVEPSNPLRERFPALQFEPEKASQFSPLDHVSPDDAPTLLVHGDKDELVPIWHSEKIAAAFDEHGVPHELIVIKGAAHGFDAEGNRRMMEGLLGWFEKQLMDEAPTSGE